MSSHRVRGALAVTGTVLLLVVVTAGCGRRGLPAAPGDGAGAAAATAGPATAGPATATESPAAAVPESPDPEPTPAASLAPTQPAAASSQPAAAPLATPDLAAIDDLLEELDAALGADATADTDEGRPR
jgi:hypothetical protein